MNANVHYLTRADIAARHKAMPPYARGRQALESLAQVAVHAEMRAMFAAINRAMDEAAAEIPEACWSDPEINPAFDLTGSLVP